MEELFSELLMRNSQLYAHPESEGGHVVRVENLLTLKIQQGGKLLVQTHQQLSDGRVQEMWQLLGCKLPPNELESPLRTAERMMKQELGLDYDAHVTNIGACLACRLQPRPQRPDRAGFLFRQLHWIG